MEMIKTASEMMRSVRKEPSIVDKLIECVMDDTENGRVTWKSQNDSQTLVAFFGDETREYAIAIEKNDNDEDIEKYERYILEVFDAKTTDKPFMVAEEYTENGVFNSLQELFNLALSTISNSEITCFDIILAYMKYHNRKKAMEHIEKIFNAIQ